MISEHGNTQKMVIIGVVLDSMVEGCEAIYASSFAHAKPDLTRRLRPHFRADKMRMVEGYIRELRDSGMLFMNGKYLEVNLLLVQAWLRDITAEVPETHVRSHPVADKLQVTMDVLFATWDKFTLVISENFPRQAAWSPA